MDNILQKFGYLIMISAGLSLIGYIVNILWRVAFPEMDTILKIILLVGISGLLITVGGLILERRKDKKSN